jgi:hypothetical protein
LRAHFIGLGYGYLLVAGLRVADVGVRHATEVTTAVRNISPMLLMWRRADSLDGSPVPASGS